VQVGRAPSAASRVVMMDVARRAGVSQKTVSRVVNNAPYVRADVRDRVSRAIAELGYRPNVAAQALARERTHAVGVLTLGSPLHGPSRRVFSLERAARHRGYTLALASMPDLSAASVAEGIDSLLSRGVEGVVLEVPTHLVELDAVQLGGLPVVTSAGRIPGITRQTVIDIEQREICRMLTQHLLDLGHDTVWHLAGPRNWDAARKRLSGWRLALRTSGRRIPPVLFGDWSARSGYNQGQKLAARDEVTAIFAANDHMAMGVLRALAEAGRTVPDDVSVVGFDDVPEAEFQMVPLTTVAIDADASAERILSELVRMIEGGEPARADVELGAEIVLRKSAGSPPNHHKLNRSVRLVT
jgi:DNA-binding LacI/PurR family transcriptional regulator